MPWISYQHCTWMMQKMINRWLGWELILPSNLVGFLRGVVCFLGERGLGVAFCWFDIQLCGPSGLTMILSSLLGHYMLSSWLIKSSLPLGIDFLGDTGHLAPIVSGWWNQLSLGTGGRLGRDRVRVPLIGVLSLLFGLCLWSWGCRLGSSPFGASSSDGGFLGTRCGAGVG